MIFHKKASRSTLVARSAVFWWQGVLLFVGTALIWMNFPFSLLRRPIPAFPPLVVTPRAAYVKVDPAFARSSYKKIFSAWLARPFGLGATGLELDTVQLDLALPAPAYLPQSRAFIGAGRPFVPPPPSVTVPDVELPGIRAAEPFPQPRKAGIRIHLSPELARAGFKIVFPEGAAFAEGAYRFSVETAADGTVENLLLLSPPSAGAAAVERFLQRATAKGGARGILTLDCNP